MSHGRHRHGTSRAGAPPPPKKVESVVQMAAVAAAAAAAGTSASAWRVAGCSKEEALKPHGPPLSGHAYVCKRNVMGGFEQPHLKVNVHMHATAIA